MANFFDQFDAPAQSGNYFDQFDATSRAQAALPQTLNVAGMDTGIPLPQSVAAALVGAGKSTARIMQGVQGLFNNTPQLQARVAEENKLYAPLAAAYPKATGLGEALPAMAVPIGGAATALGAIGRAAVANAIPGLLEYGTPEERAGRGAMGAAAGAVGGAVGAGLGRLMTPFRSANPLATDEARTLADAAGITLTPAQATGSKVLSSIDGTMATFPGSAGVMAKIAQGQSEGFNRAAMMTMGEPAAASIAQDAAQVAGKNVGGRIDQAAASATVKLNTEQLINDLAGVESKYMRNLSSDQKPFVQNAINDILAAGDAVPGSTYQAWRSRLGARAVGASDSEFKGAVKGIQRALDDAFDASATAEQSAAMQAARGQYRNFKTLEPLLEKAGMSNENISPAQVATRALASGNFSPDMLNLATLGQALGRQYPNSGTAPRMFWQSVFENPLRLANPFPATAWLAARGIHNPLGRAYLTNDLIGSGAQNLLVRGGGLLGYGAQNALAPQ